MWTLEYNYWLNGDNQVAAYSIINVGSGLAAKFSGSRQPITTASNGLGDQNFCWRLDSVEGGSGYYAINRWDGAEVMDVKGASCDAGTPIISQGWHHADNQRWHIDPA